MKRTFFFCAFFSLFFLQPHLAHAQTGDTAFHAEVIKILEEQTKTSTDGIQYTQQHLQLRALSSEAGVTIFSINNIQDFQTLNEPMYKVGDKVLVQKEVVGQNEPTYAIIDFVRTPSLLWLTGIFLVCALIIGGRKGLRSLLVLALTFFIIIVFTVPQIIAGKNPVIVSVLSSVVIMFLSIFGTEGWNSKSKTAFLSVLISLFILTLLSSVFTAAAQLTGLWSEEVLFLTSSFGIAINTQGILLAGMIIATLGVLDDVIINQVSLVHELYTADKTLNNSMLFRKAMNVGRDHINALINTLFLVYAGASLPLLLLFSTRVAPFTTFSSIVNNELVAAEIVRTLVGSIVIIASVPIATALTLWTVRKKQ